MAEAIGILNPGEMGAAVAGELVAAGHEVYFAGLGRSPASLERARRAGLEDAGTVDELAARSAVLLSIVPPDAALGLARSLAGFAGTFVDANAIAPATASEVARVVRAGGASFVDGGIIGTPPSAENSPRLYLSGERAASVAALFATTRVDARVLDGDETAASAVKIGYSAWSKASAAMLLAVRTYARAAGIEDALLAEWAQSQPDLAARIARAYESARTKAWRWAGEMDEIAAAFAALDLPPEFHRGAAETYRRASPDGVRSDPADLDALLGDLADPGTSVRHRKALEEGR